jgi:hypothetical protein
LRLCDTVSLLSFSWHFENAFANCEVYRALRANAFDRVVAVSPPALKRTSHSPR